MAKVLTRAPAMAKEKENTGTTVLAPESKTKLQKPPLYKVFLHNDDFTPRDFVVLVLREVFALGDGEAQTVMMHAHNHGLAVVGLYTYEIAETKVTLATKFANEASFPLLFTMEVE
jgi:ATP-dependent Clp protease adaptor protein ClpS